MRTMGSGDVDQLFTPSAQKSPAQLQNKEHFECFSSTPIILSAGSSYPFHM